MKIEFNIDDRIVAVAKRVFSRRNVVVGCVFGLSLSIAVVVSASVVSAPNTFEANKIISAEDMNENFAALAKAASVYTNPDTGKTYSTNASYCGKTAAQAGNITSGARTGYAAAKAQCEAVCSSASAHMCTGAELTRYVATGSIIAGEPAKWISSGLAALGGFSTSDPMSDCDGYTSKLVTDRGPAFGAAGPTSALCDGEIPIACCD